MFKKYIHLFAGLLAFLYTGCLLVSCAPAEYTNKEAVAWMDKEPIELTLFEKEMKNQEFNIRIHFNGRYGVRLDSEPEGWTKEYKEGVPLKLLKEAALEEAKKTKATLLVAREKGLIKTVSFYELQKYGAGNMEKAFKAGIGAEEVSVLSAGDRDVFARFMEIVKHELKKALREDTGAEDIKGLIRERGTGELENYMRLGPGDGADVDRLAGDIFADPQKLSVARDLIQEDKYNAAIRQKIESSQIKVNEEVYEKVFLER